MTMLSIRRTMLAGRHGMAGLTTRGAFGVAVAIAVYVAMATPAMAGAQVAYNIFPAGETSVSMQHGQPGRKGADAKISLDVHDSTLKYVINAMVHQTNLRPVFGTRSPVLAKRVTVRFTNVEMLEALRSVLQGTHLIAAVTPDGETVVIRDATDEQTTPGANAATGIVMGSVVDSVTGQGLDGATVRIQGTMLSATTTNKGHFELRNVPMGEQVLSVRLVGFRPATRMVTVPENGSTTVRVVMGSAPTVLSGVVTTATGTQRRIEVGNDITTINADSVMKVAPISSVTDLLETRVPGLTVVHSSGAPGDPARIRIRGAGSIQLNNDPIVIVDGIRVYANQSDSRNQNLAPATGIVNTGAAQFTAPSPLDQIDPNSIATIEVLKGPSASAIYGSDAANGVIVITTKRGRAGPTHWNLAAGAGVNWLPGDWPVNYYKFGGNLYAQKICDWFDTYCDVDSVVAFQALNDSRYTVFSHGNMQDASLTVSGGSPTMQYSLTGSGAGNLGYLKLPGSEQHLYDSLYAQRHGPIPNYLIRPDRYKTWGVNGQFTMVPQQRLTFTVVSSVFTSAQQQSSLQGAINQLQGYYISPIFGTLSPKGGTANQPAGTPLLAGEFTRATDDQQNISTAFHAQWRPVTWLPDVNVTGGLNTLQRTDVTYVPFGIYNSTYSFGLQSDPTDTTGWYGLGRGTSHDQTFGANMGDIALSPWVRLGVGASLHAGSTVDYTVSTNQLAPGVSVPTQFILKNCMSGGGGVCYSPSAQQSSHQSTWGYFVEPRMKFLSRFFVSPGFRLDGGSGGSRSAGSWGNLSGFPKMDLSYVAVDRQDDTPLGGFLTLLRPRLAFGLSGRQPGVAQKLRLFNVGSFFAPVPTAPGQGSLGTAGQCAQQVTLDGTTTVPAVCLSTLGNTQLRPERTGEVEGGGEASLWRGRLSLDYTHSQKVTHDAIIAVPIAPSVYSDLFGSAQIEKNIGVVRNTTDELLATVNVLQGRSAGLSFDANWSANDNKVVRLNKGVAPLVFSSGANFGGVQTRVQAGYPLYGVFARPITGFADANGNGVIEATEVRYGDSAVYLGRPDPKSQLTLTGHLTLLDGRLGVHAAVNYQDGMTQDNAAACQTSSFDLLPNNPSTTLATQAAIVAAGCSGAAPKVTNVGLAQTVNTFRFQSVSVNYILPTSVAAWFRVPRASVALQGENLALHTNYRGIDPNVNAFSTVSAGDQTADTGQIPLPRQWSLRVTLGN